MNGTYFKTQYGKNPYYVCSGCVELGDRKKSIVSATQLDNILLNRIKERFFNSNRITNVLKHIKNKLNEQTKDDSLTAEEIAKGILDVDRKTDALLDTIDPRHGDLINKRLDGLRIEKERLVAEKEKIAVAKVHFNSDKLAEEILSQAGDFDKVLEQGSPSERKEIVRSYIGQIIIDTDRRFAKVGFYPLPKTPATESILYGYAMNLER